jgi:hypothetical protein
MRKRLLSNIGDTPYQFLSDVQKKAPGRNLPGAYSHVYAPLEDLFIFQHTSPERLVRMMVMMVACSLNACHKILV